MASVKPGLAKSLQVFQTFFYTSVSPKFLTPFSNISVDTRSPPFMLLRIMWSMPQFSDLSIL